MSIKYMNTIEDRIKDCERWKQAEKNLKGFKGMMELVKQYHIKHKWKLVPPPRWYLTSDLPDVGVSEYCVPIVT